MSPAPRDDTRSITAVNERYGYSYQHIDVRGASNLRAQRRRAFVTEQSPFSMRNEDVQTARRNMIRKLREFDLMFITAASNSSNVAGSDRYSPASGTQAISSYAPPKAKPIITQNLADNPRQEAPTSFNLEENQAHKQASAPGSSDKCEDVSESRDRFDSVLSTESDSQVSSIGALLQRNIFDDKGPTVSGVRLVNLSTGGMSPSSIAVNTVSSGEDASSGDDDEDENLYEAGRGHTIARDTMDQSEAPNSNTQPVLSEMKQEIVDRMMLEFWEMIDHRNDFDDHTDGESFGTSKQEQEQDAVDGGEHDTTQTPSGSQSTSGPVERRSTSGQDKKTRRQDQEDDGDEETERRKPKRPKKSQPSPGGRTTPKFACPYRKHDSRKYCIQSSWRLCALNSFVSVHRLKEHLYRYHRIYFCRRCKILFDNQKEVDEHQEAVEGCQLLGHWHHDGITTEMYNKLRSKKKAHRDQTEEDRWRDIYHLLFPGEISPSPYFEEVREDGVPPTETPELADFEQYSRQELPRVVRALLENIVDNMMQPVEEQLRSRLVDIVRDAHDLVSSNYRASSSTAVATTTGSGPNSQPETTRLPHPLSSPLPLFFSPEDQTQPPFFHPPSPRIHLESGFVMSHTAMEDPKTEEDQDHRSDSGYGSNLVDVPAASFPVNESLLDTSLFRTENLPSSHPTQQVNQLAEAVETQEEFDLAADETVKEYDHSTLAPDAFIALLDSELEGIFGYDMNQAGDTTFPESFDGST